MGKSIPQQGSNLRDWRTLLQSSTTWGPNLGQCPRELRMEKCLPIGISRVHEDFPVLVGGLKYVSSERFGDLAQLNGTLCGIILKRCSEVDVAGVLRILLDREGGGLLL